MCEKKRKIKEIQNRLNKYCDLHNMNMLNNNCSYDDANKPIYLTEDIMQLRKFGINIILPVSYIDVDQPGSIFCQAATEIIRQIDNYLHPFKFWIKAHIYESCAVAISIIALIIGILK